MFDTVLSKMGEIFKLPARLGFTLCVSCAAVIYLGSQGIIPGVTGLLLTTLWILAAFFAAVAAAGLLSVLQKLCEHVFSFVSTKRKRRAMRKQFIEEIPLLTERERQIFGYLLHRNQNTFTAEQDAGHASTLVARSYIYSIGVPGQTVRQSRIPFRVQPDVWQVLQERAEEFPYRPETHRGSEIAPWVIPFM